MIRPIFFVATMLPIFIMSCKSGASGNDTKQDSVDVKNEVVQTAQKIEDSTGKVDVQKLEQMMEDAK
jgi:hypothetical protein